MHPSLMIGLFSVYNALMFVFFFQPVNLLYKPLSDFQEELLPQDIPLRTIYNVYDEHEHDRQSKTHC